MIYPFFEARSPFGKAEEKSMSDPVYDGDFFDEAWAAAAAKKAPDRTRSEAVLANKPPRRHPFPEASVHVEEVYLSDGTRKLRYFESKDSSKQWKSRHESGDQKLKAKPLRGYGSSQEASETGDLAVDAELAVTSPQDTPDVEVPVGSPAPVQAEIDQRAARSRGGAATEIAGRGGGR